MHLARCLLIFALLPVLVGTVCTSVDPFLPPLPGKPYITAVKLGVIKDPLTGYSEAVHLSWSAPNTDSVIINTYTLIRMLPEDSIFDIFPLSQYIPADTLQFFDPLEPAHFSPGSGHFNSMYYRIYAVDEFGRHGDTSDICTLLLVAQPQFETISEQGECISWNSDLHIGGLFSHCVLWNDARKETWTSQRYDAFPPTDAPALFKACFPESLRPLPTGRWYYALFLEAVETRSLKVGYIDVP